VTAKRTDWPARLRKFRKDNGLTIAAAAERLGVATQSWHLWEHGRKPSPLYAAAINSFLEKPLTQDTSVV